MRAQQPVEMILLRQVASYLTIPIWMMDSDGNLVFYNEPAETLLGIQFDEVGPVQDVIKRGKHPYTHGLMKSIPVVRQDVEQLMQIEGAMPRLTDIPSGCAFHPRCPRAFEHCRIERPDLVSVGAVEAACWLYDDAHRLRPDGEA